MSGTAVSQDQAADSRRVAVVTGGSRGIGRQAVLRLAADGYALVVGYTGKRGGAETAVDVAKAVARLVAMPAVTRPLRAHIDHSRDGSEVVSAVVDRVRAGFFRRIGLEQLLTPGSSL